MAEEQSKERAEARRGSGLVPQTALGFWDRIQTRWNAMPPNARGAMLVSVGSLTLVFMAVLVKILGSRLPSFEILFFRSALGFLMVLPVFMSNPMEPFRTKRPGMHLARGAAGALGNACFFWTITHLVLADAMALQFSRPLFMIPLALLFLNEVVGFKRTMVAFVGFAGIMLYTRPFSAGFDPGALIGALGALGGGLVVICIKRLSTTEPTRVIMFYYAFWNAVFAAIPAFWWWVWPTQWELLLLFAVAVLGIGGQALITHGFTMGDATALVPLDYFRIIYSAIIAYLIFGELPGLWSLAGMALIVSASLYLVLTEKRGGKG